jgi:vanillate O-demethylase ferredoxin subunit
MARHIALVVEQALEDGPLTRRLVLRDPDGWPLPRWKPGAHLDLMVPGIGPRAYSLCGDPATTDRWEVAVKREPASRGGSAWLHEALRPGDAVDATMPRCTFPIAANANRHVMVAGGIGVTPLLAMARALERQGADWALHLLCRGAPPCGEVLTALGPRVQVRDTLRASRPAWDRLLGTPEPGLHAYCCGPEAMLDGFASATARWPEGSATMEHFVPPPLPTAEGAVPYTLRRAATGEEATVEAGGSMLAALRGLGVKVDTSCEGGICGACEVRWVEGTPIHRDRVLSPERRKTHLMACVAQCASSHLVVEG